MEVCVSGCCFGRGRKESERKKSRWKERKKEREKEAHRGRWEMEAEMAFIKSFDTLRRCWRLASRVSEGWSFSGLICCC